VGPNELFIGQLLRVAEALPEVSENEQGSDYGG
jgi:hypothetical protein